MFTGRNDTWQLMRKLTWSRLYNAMLIFCSFYFSRLIRKPVIWGNPVSLSFETTTSCNLRCPECPSGLRSFTRPTGMLQSDLFHKTIDELAPSLLYLILYFQGEPYLNPNFLSLVRYAHQKNIYTATSTNAHYLDDDNARATVESGLDRLIISIDGTTQETYEQYRIGGSLEKVMEGTKNIVKWKKQLNSSTPHIVFQFLAVRPNEHQIVELGDLAKELGVDQVAIKTAQLYDFEHGNDLMPTIDQYSRYKERADGTFILKSKLMNHCWKMWHSSVVTWDGQIVPCCFDKDASHSFGNLSGNTFKQIWSSESYDNFRQALLKSRSEIDICQNCTEGTKVWA